MSLCQRQNQSQWMMNQHKGYESHSRMMWMELKMTLLDQSQCVYWDMDPCWKDLNWDSCCVCEEQGILLGCSAPSLWHALCAVWHVDLMRTDLCKKNYIFHQLFRGKASYKSDPSSVCCGNSVEIDKSYCRPTVSLCVSSNYLSTMTRSYIQDDHIDAFYSISGSWKMFWRYARTLPPEEPCCLRAIVNLSLALEPVPSHLPSGGNAICQGTVSVI